MKTPRQIAQEREARIFAEKLKRAKELIAYMDTVGITINWEGEYTTFHPASGTPQRLIEEATILSDIIRGVKEGRYK